MLRRTFLRAFSRHINLERNLHKSREALVAWLLRDSLDQLKNTASRAEGPGVYRTRKVRLQVNENKEGTSTDDWTKAADACTSFRLCPRASMPCLITSIFPL